MPVAIAISPAHLINPRTCLEPTAVALECLCDVSHARECEFVPFVSDHFFVDEEDFSRNVRMGIERLRHIHHHLMQGVGRVAGPYTLVLAWAKRARVTAASAGFELHRPIFV